MWFLINWTKWVIKNRIALWIVVIHCEYKKCQTQITSGSERRTALIKQRTQKNASMIDLFAGCGSWIDAACPELGIRLETILAWDILEEATAVYKENFPETTVRNDDIAKIIDGNGEDPTSQEKYFQRGWRHQPRRGTSLSRKFKPQQPHQRNWWTKPSVFRMARIIELTQPEYAIIENVAGVRRAKCGLRYCWELSFCCWRIDWWRKIGVPQTRKRHFTIASKSSSLELAEVQTSACRKTKTNILGDSRPVDRVYSEDDISITHPKQTRLIKQGCDTCMSITYDLPSSERPKCHQNIQNMALLETLTPQCMDECTG